MTLLHVIYRLVPLPQSKILATPMHYIMFNMHTRYRLCVTPTFTSGCLQHCKGAKYTLHCFKSKSSLVWKYRMEYGRKFKYGMEDFYYGMEENCQNGI